MRAMKALVIGLGICIIAAFITVVVMISQRVGRPSEAGVAVVARPPTQASWGRVMLDQPAGTRVHSVTSSGHLIVLQLYTAMPGQDERLVVLDPGSGAVIGSFVVAPNPR